MTLWGYDADMTATASFQSSTGFLLSQLGVLATRSWTALLVERDLTSHQHAILLTLREQAPVTLTALAVATLVDARNLGPVLEPLERRGLIARADDPADRRRRLIALTATGEQVAAELAAAALAIEDDLLRPLRADDREVLRQHLLTLWRNAKALP